MAEHASVPQLPREPGLPARFFVFAFAWSAPLLVIGAGFATASVYVRVSGAAGIAGATVVGLACAAALLAGVRGVRILAARFTPPLPLPGDIWNIGVVEERPRRSANWPIRLVRRRPA